MDGWMSKLTDRRIDGISSAGPDEPLSESELDKTRLLVARVASKMGNFRLAYPAIANKSAS